MRTLNSECSDSESSNRSLSADILMREEPEDEEEEEDDEEEHEEEHDDVEDEDGNEGYSE
jgi:hypothetical protein